MNTNGFACIQDRKVVQRHCIDWEVGWQAWQNHCKIVKETIQEFEIPRQSYSRRMENQPEIGKRFTRVTEISTRRSDSSKTNGIPMVLHGSQDREVVQRRGIRSWSWLGSVTKVITTSWEPCRNVKSHGYITPDVWKIIPKLRKVTTE